MIVHYASFVASSTLDDAVLELTICEEYALILAHDGDRHASHLTS